LASEDKIFLPVILQEISIQIMHVPK
jgi:hypothetical protein